MCGGKAGSKHEEKKTSFFGFSRKHHFGSLHLKHALSRLLTLQSIFRGHIKSNNMKLFCHSFAILACDKSSAWESGENWSGKGRNLSNVSVSKKRCVSAIVIIVSSRCSLSQLSLGYFTVKYFLTPLANGLRI